MTDTEVSDLCLTIDSFLRTLAEIRALPEDHGYWLARKWCEISPRPRRPARLKLHRP